MVEILNSNCLWWRDGGNGEGEGIAHLRYWDSGNQWDSGHIIISHRGDTLALGFLRETLADHPVDLGKKRRTRQNPCFVQLTSCREDRQQTRKRLDFFLNCKNAIKGNEQCDEMGVGGALQGRWWESTYLSRGSVGWSWDKEARTKPATQRSGWGEWRGHYWFWFCLYFFHRI